MKTFIFIFFYFIFFVFYCPLFAVNYINRILKNKFIAHDEGFLVFLNNKEVSNDDLIYCFSFINSLSKYWSCLSEFRSKRQQIQPACFDENRARCEDEIRHACSVPSKMCTCCTQVLEAAHTSKFEPHTDVLKVCKIWWRQNKLKRTYFHCYERKIAKSELNRLGNEWRTFFLYLDQDENF